MQVYGCVFAYTNGGGVEYEFVGLSEVCKIAFSKVVALERVGVRQRAFYESPGIGFDHWTSAGRVKLGHS